MTLAPISAALAIVTFAVPVFAQTPTVVRLGPATGAMPNEFTEVTSALEVAPGRVLVADASERKVMLLDFGTSTSRAIGRIGSGPKEFRSMSTLLRRPGGGAYLVDFALRRLLPIGADGAIGEAIAMPATSLLVNGIDSVGRIYANAMIFNQRELSDSMRVLRWDVVTSKVDTLLTFDAGRSSMVSHAGQPHRIWAVTTSWTTLPSGELVFLNAGSYRLSTWVDGHETKAATIPLARALVTESDKAAWTRAQEGRKARALGQGAGAGGSGPAFRDGVAFPATYPAFDQDTPLRFAADGMLWVERLGNPLEVESTYDVIAPAGRVVSRVVLPPRSVVATFGRGVVYLVDKGVDDVLTISRHAYPNLRP